MSRSDWSFRRRGRSITTRSSPLRRRPSAISYSDRRKYAQYLLHIILGGTMSSRLFLRIREDLGLAYNVGSYFPTLADVGWGTIYAGVDPDKAEQTVAAILDELARLRTEPVTPTEF